MSTDVSMSILDILQQATADGPVVRLNQQLDRATYLEVDAVLKRLGGRWDRRANGHRFTVDAQPIIDHLVNGGAVRPRNQTGDFHTPRAVAKMVVEFAGLTHLRAGARVLEPSAGRGALALATRDCHSGLVIECVEIDPLNAMILREHRLATVEQDFMAFTPDAPYDAVIANPPYHGAAYARHLHRATDFVRPDGTITAIVPARYRECATVYEEWLTNRVRFAGSAVDLGDQVFVEQGATIATHMVRWTVQ